MLLSSFFTRSMAFTHIPKVQLSFALFSETFFNDTAEFTLCYGLHDCSHLFQGYFIHSLSTLYYYNAPSLTTRLTGDYRDRTYTGKCSPALLDTRKRKAGNLNDFLLGETVNVKLWLTYWLYKLEVVKENCSSIPQYCHSHHRM